MLAVGPRRVSPVQPQKERQKKKWIGVTHPVATPLSVTVPLPLNTIRGVSEKFVMVGGHALQEGPPPSFLPMKNANCWNKPLMKKVQQGSGQLPYMSLMALAAHLFSTHHVNQPRTAASRSWAPADALPRQTWQIGRLHPAASKSSSDRNGSVSRSCARWADCLWLHSGTSSTVIRWILLCGVAMKPLILGGGGVM